MRPTRSASLPHFCATTTYYNGPTRTGVSKDDFVGFFKVLEEDAADENAQSNTRSGAVKIDSRGRVSSSRTHGRPPALRGTAASLPSTVRVVPASVGELLERADQPEHLGPVIRAYSLWYMALEKRGAAADLEPLERAYEAERRSWIDDIVLAASVAARTDGGGGVSSSTSVDPRVGLGLLADVWRERRSVELTARRSNPHVRVRVRQEREDGSEDHSDSSGESSSDEESDSASDSGGGANRGGEDDDGKGRVVEELGPGGESDARGRRFEYDSAAPQFGSPSEVAIVALVTGADDVVDLNFSAPRLDGGDAYRVRLKTMVESICRLRIGDITEREEAWALSHAPKDQDKMGVAFADLRREIGDQVKSGGGALYNQNVTKEDCNGYLGWALLALTEFNIGSDAERRRWCDPRGGIDELDEDGDHLDLDDENDQDQTFGGGFGTGIPVRRFASLLCGFDRAFGWKLGAARCEDWAKDWDGTSNGRVTAWDIKAFMKGDRPARRWPGGGGGKSGDDSESGIDTVAILDLNDPNGKVSKVMAQVIRQFEARGVVFNEAMALLQQVKFH